MPLYEYICESCGEASELLVANHRVNPACPKCGLRKLQRQLSTFAAHSGSSRPCATCPASEDTCGGACPLG